MEGGKEAVMILIQKRGKKPEQFLYFVRRRDCVGEVCVSGGGGLGRSLTWVTSGAMGERVGQVGQLARVIAILQGAHVHVVPPAELAEPRAPLFTFGVGIEYDAHPQGTCRHPDNQVKQPDEPLGTKLNLQSSLQFKRFVNLIFFREGV